MVDFHLIRSTDHKQPAAESEQEEDQAVPEPIVVDFVYNTYEERNGTTIALKISFSVPRHRTSVPAANR